MRARTPLIWAALVGLTGTLQMLASSVEKVKNQKVLVVEDTLAPGESEPIAGDHPSVVVYLAGNSAELSFAGGAKRQASIVRGDTRREQADWTKLTNTGTSSLRLVRVEFLTDGSGDTWGMEGLPPNYKLLFEDRYSRTYDIRIPAHEKEQQHTHHDRVVVCLSGAILEHLLPDGRKQPSTLKTDEVDWRLGQTHVGHNIGDTDLWVIAIEPK